MFTRNSVLIALVIALAAAATALSQAPPVRPADKIRIGTYNTRAVAVAYLRSPGLADEMKRLVREADKAKAAGDEKRLKELLPQGENAQRRAHAQVFSNAPIDNILPKLEASMPAIAKQANVVVIVPSADWHDPSVELVDVTDLLAEQFKPSPETKKVMADVRKQAPPMDLVEAVMMND